MNQTIPSLNLYFSLENIPTLITTFSEELVNCHSYGITQYINTENMVTDISGYINGFVKAYPNLSADDNIPNCCYETIGHIQVILMNVKKEFMGFDKGQLSREFNSMDITIQKEILDILSVFYETQE